MSYTIVVETTVSTLYIHCEAEGVAATVLKSIEDDVRATIAGCIEWATLRYSDSYGTDGERRGKDIVLNPAHIVRAILVEDP